MVTGFNIKKSSKGFTLLEILIAMVVIGIISGGFYLRSARQARQQAQDKTCFHTRGVIARAGSRYYFDRETHPAHFRDLYDSGYISVIPECPSGGVYAWLLPEGGGGFESVQVVCSVHGFSEEDPEAAPDGIIEYDFNHGNDDGWTKIGNNWEVIDGKYYGGPGGEHRSFYGNDDWEDYTIEVDAALLAGTPSGGYGYGIYFRASGYEERDTLNAYVFQYDPFFGGGEFIFRKVVSGGERAPTARAPAPEGYNWTGDEKNIRIEVRGNTFTAYISDINGGGVPVLTATDPDFGAGAVGFRTWSDSRASFDNLIVRLKE